MRAQEQRRSDKAHDQDLEGLGLVHHDGSLDKGELPLHQRFPPLQTCGHPQKLHTPAQMPGRPALQFRVGADKGGQEGVQQGVARGGRGWCGSVRRGGGWGGGGERGGGGGNRGGGGVVLQGKIRGRGSKIFWGKTGAGGEKVVPCL